MRIGVLGAGSIGCSVGGRLSLGGADVVLVGRQRTKDALHGGIHLTRWGDAPLRVSREDFRFETDPAALADRDLVLVCVKSGDTAAAAEELSRSIHPTTIVVSLQNGVRNVPILRAALPAYTVWPAMVPFNIQWTEDGRFHQGTSGPIVVPSDGVELVRALRAGDCSARTVRDVVGVQWGKLLLNLNNAVNALAGLPLRVQLADAGYRAVIAAVIDEGRTVLRAAGIKARGVGRIQPALAPRILRLPDGLFFRVASAMIAIDPAARSSMQDDLLRGRTTEVEELNGEIVQRAAAAGVPAPINATLVRLIHQAEAAGGSPHMGPAALARAINE